ncbi:MAG: DNA polymerase III subunit alpha [Phycisphaerae bacterium]
MSPGKFTHLHVHTHFSLLDGAVRIKDLIEKTKSQGSSAVAMTDHGNLFGVVPFYQAAVKAGVKPILGCEVYMAPGDRRERESRGIQEASYHLLLLAKNRTGYANLLKLASIAYREGFYYRPRIDKEVLRAHREGLIGMSGCLGGEVPQALLRGDVQAAEEITRTYLDILGEDGFFLELQDQGMDEQKVVNPALIDLAGRLGVGLAATNDVHYLEVEDAEAHEVLCCISTGKRLTDDDRMRLPSNLFYLRSPAEMWETFKDVPEALENTQRIADMCNVELEFGKTHAPVYRVPGGKSDRDYLRELVYEGARARYGEITDEIRERIDYELEVISSKGFCSYFLIVWDFVNYARSRGIPSGARGSGCSTVVGYCLGLSAPDPLRYGLYFERFMDPDRDEMPDIDIDICQEGREEVIDYVRKKYGQVAQIITFGTLQPRAAVKDVGRVLGLGFEETNAITKLIPEELKMTIDKAMEKEPDLRRLYSDNEQIRKVIDIARRLEGLSRHTGVHAAGVVICDEPLESFIPLYQPPGTDQVITQFDGPSVEACGLLKMDFLGLKTLTVLERARQLVKKQQGIDLDLDRIELDDQNVYQLFVRGETKGVFQFESGGMRDVVMKMKPNRIEDLIAANALYRPGPMVHIDAYVARKHGEQWSTPHPIMTEVLKETYGILVYQEQVSRLVNRLGGIELKQAFRLAKAISKKKTAMIESMREPFVKGCAEKGVPRQTAEEIFEDILRFGGYAFNKSHSTGYALVAYKTAYMKVYYPTEYMAALLTLEMDSTDKVVEYIEECKRMGIRVSAPDVNLSDNDFTVIRSEQGKGEIRFGLQAIKGVGEKAVSAIRAARSEGGPFRSIFDFCERVDLSAVNRGVLEALIKCGAFDSTGATRKGLTMVLDDAIAAGTSAAADRRCGQLSLFDGLRGLVPRAEPRIPGDQWSEAEMLAHEKATLGFYVTRHPLASHEQTLLKYATARTCDLKRYDDGAEVILGGLISRMRTMLTKSGRNAGSKMAIVTLEDLWGQVEVMVFSSDLEKYQAQLAPESLVFFKGRVDRRREEPSLKATELIPMELGDERLSSSVLLKVNCVGAEASLLKRIRETIDRFRGDRTVLIEMLTSGNLKVTLRANGRSGVTPTADFRRAMEAILGEGSVVLKGSGRSLELQTGLTGSRREHLDESSACIEEVDDEPL